MDKIIKRLKEIANDIRFYSGRERVDILKKSSDDLEIEIVKMENEIERANKLIEGPLPTRYVRTVGNIIEYQIWINDNWLTRWLKIK